MKKPVVKQRLLFRIMKITLFQFVLAFVFSSVTMANSVKGQGKLDTKVTISLNNVNLDHALSKLQKSADVKFSYNSRMPQLNEKVSINANNEALSSILDRTLKLLNIGYTEVGNQIILQKEIAVTDGFTEENAQTTPLESLLADITIKGKVVDEKGTPIYGANILVKG